MAKKPQTDWEKAARALCRHDGHPEDVLIDDDGNGAHAATQFATISHGLAMTADEFYVI